ncbi:unnamed protein product [Colias eurytheme]|nr:unnamed protein product [Colias eurytheme]
MFIGCKSNINYFMKKHKTYLQRSFLDDIPDDLKININDHPGPANVQSIVTPVSILNSEDINGQSSCTSTSVTPSSHIPSGSCSFENNNKSRVGYRQELRSRKRLMDHFQNDSPNKVIKAFVSSMAGAEIVSPKSKKDLESVIQSCLQTPSRATKVHKSITKEIQPYTPEEALGVIIDRKLSVETYIDMQQDLQRRGCPVMNIHLMVK